MLRKLGLGLLIGIFFFFIFEKRTEAQNTRKLEQKRKALTKKIKENTQNLGKKKKEITALKKSIKEVQDLLQSHQGREKIFEDSIIVLEKALLVSQKYAGELAAQRLVFTRLYKKVMKACAYRNQTSYAYLQLLDPSTTNKNILSDFYLMKCKVELSKLLLVQSSKEEHSKKVGDTYRVDLDKLSSQKTALSKDAQDWNKGIEKEKKQLARLEKRSKTLKKTIRKQERNKTALTKQIKKAIRRDMRTSKQKARKSSSKPRNPSKGLPKYNARKVTKDFSAHKGRLRMPLKNGRIVRGFGRKNHKEYIEVIVENNGIDIKGKKGQKAQAVFQGVVVSVFTLPTNQNAVMVQHGDYYTTYSNLSTVYVRRGEQVGAGTNLGKVSKESKSGNYILHFELWKKKIKYNPAYWLRK